MPSSLLLDVPVALIKDPCAWTVEDISVWLHWLGMGEHVEAFAAHRVDGRLLLQLSADSAWADLGVVDPAQQLVLDSAVEPLKCFREAEGTESGFALHAIEGPVAGEVFFVGAGGITGGRHSASNGIVLSENYVSRRHFQIIRDPAGQHSLQDVGSTTGTFLMVRDELSLDNAMILQLGTTEITVQIDDGGECTLVATEGPDKDAEATVPPQGLFIGREGSNGLCIRDPQISAFHCEVRHAEDQGYVLDDKYSTNRTWLRLAQDGQPSKRYVLAVGDLFKVGSTLFHVVDPATLASEATTGTVQLGSEHNVTDITAMQSPHSERAALEASAAVDAATEDEFVAVPPADRSVQDLPVALSLSAGSISNRASGDEDAAPPGPQLLWEPFLEGEQRPVVSAEEYALRLTASRRQMCTDGAARRSTSGRDLYVSQDVGMYDLRERELSSLQQRMRNCRAQTAYTLQQQREAEPRDEDLCKICYDQGIDVVLYPCGHFVLCRWCAQKVSDCPVCRFVITDVIRTYKA
mmetsp:Transcript_49962/g.140828  ORF Transcript_49962/g.140828 Transcript_49962/m.140828 type:complete len:522 (-) Transcript_49962:101-1666(-)